MIFSILCLLIQGRKETQAIIPEKNSWLNKENYILKPNQLASIGLAPRYSTFEGFRSKCTFIMEKGNKKKGSLTYYNVNETSTYQYTYKYQAYIFICTFNWENNLHRGDFGKV